MVERGQRSRQRGRMNLVFLRLPTHVEGASVDPASLKRLVENAGATVGRAARTRPRFDLYPYVSPLTGGASHAVPLDYPLC